MRVSAILTRLLHRVGLLDAVARRAAVRGRFALVLHGISGSRSDALPEAAQPYLDARGLRRTLAWLAGRFPLLDADEFLHGDTAGVLLTFDDGYANNHRHALPQLQEVEAPAIFFVTTQHVQDPRNWLPSIRQEVTKVWGDAEQVPTDVARELYDGMSSDQLAACAKQPGITIGSHSLSHPFLTRLEGAELRRELEVSRRQLVEWTDQAVELFAYPTGDYNGAVARAVEEAGYRAAFAEDSRHSAHDGVFEIPRIGIYSSEPWYLAAKLSGLFRRPLPLDG